MLGLAPTPTTDAVLSQVIAHWTVQGSEILGNSALPPFRFTSRGAGGFLDL